jgi:site-specific DNA-methyltransferase (adenine-specific)
MKRMPEEFVDLTVTSPPYDDIRHYNDNIHKTWGEHVWKPVLEELYRVTKKGGVLVWVVGDATQDGSETGTSFKQALFAKEIGFNINDTMIWNKGCLATVGALQNRYAQVFEYMFVLTKGYPKTFTPIKDRPNIHAGTRRTGTVREADGRLHEKATSGRINADYGIRFNIWKIHPKPRKGETHPATFPIQIVADHIRSWSKEGELVYDPFMGSGTVAVVCKALNRKFVGSEISKEYAIMARERCAEKFEYRPNKEKKGLLY